MASKNDLKSRYAELSEKSFKSVFESEIVYDNKAVRILTAVAFLTAAEIAIYANTNSYQVYILKFDWSKLSLFMYLTFVILGVAFYLVALGPKFNLHKGWGLKTETPDSLLFFMLIGRMKNEDWLDFWNDKKSKLAEIDDLLARNFQTEAYLISQSINAKILLMSIGNIMFRVGLIFLGFSATVITDNSSLAFGLSIAILFVLLIIFLLDYSDMPRKLANRMIT